VEYPRALAITLKQGTVVVDMTLTADGRITDLRLVASSGYNGFDDELLRALRVASSFGPVPTVILGKQNAIVVRTPYAFRNPLIR
jgi:TonB family protein